jgi:hypothetical protein
VCEPSFGDSAKINSLQLSDRAAGGPALDINSDGRVDNALGGLAGLVNGPLTDAISGGDIKLVMEFDGFRFGDFIVSLHQGELTGDLACDFQVETCDYLSSRSGLDPATCESIVRLPATYDGTVVLAGGPTTVMPFSLPLGGTTLDIQLYGVTARITPQLSGGQVIGFEGLLGGAAREDQLNAAIRAVPADSLPLPPESIVSTLRTLAPNDIDTNNDGIADAKSISLLVGAIDARLVGATAP